jgi:hypothetical protein
LPSRRGSAASTSPLIARTGQVMLQGHHAHLGGGFAGRPQRYHQSRAGAAGAVGAESVV